MAEESISQEFRLKNIDKTNYFIEEIDQNELKSTKRFVPLSHFRFYGYWMYFNSCFCFFA